VEGGVRDGLVRDGLVRDGGVGFVRVGVGVVGLVRVGAGSAVGFDPDGCAAGVEVRPAGLP
jgi:hypothetical protein